MTGDHELLTPEAREMRERRLKALGDKRTTMLKQLPEIESEMRSLITELLAGTTPGDGYRSLLQQLSGFSREIIRRIGLALRGNRTDEREGDEGARSSTVRHVSGGLRSTHKRAA